MSGYLGDLSSTQEKVLEEFRKKFSDLLQPQHDDYLLLQFLRARRFDLKKSEEMFRKHLRFREEFPEEYMVNEYKPPHLLLKHLLPPLLGYDKEGCPVRIIHAGHQDLKGLLSCIRRPEIRKCITWFLDTDKRDMRLRSKETGIHIETRTFIFDLEDLNFRQIYHRDVYDLVISLLRLYEGNYPENLRRAFVINAPTFFSWLFAMIKAILTDDTIHKIQIFGYSGYKDELLKHIDADILPVIYGGTRTDPDGNPRCPSVIREFYQIPKELYLKNQSRLDVKDESVKKVFIGRRSKFSIPIKVEVPNSTVGWEVDCKHCDIRVYLSYLEGAIKKTVVERTAVHSDYGSEKGVYLAEEAGNYTLVLDNSYSLLRSKEVLYKVYVSTCTANSEDIIASKETKACLIAV